MTKLFAIAAAAGLLTAFVTLGVAQDHGHLNIGATSTNQGSMLIFENGPDFHPATDYVKTLFYTNGGRYAGYYQGNITLTALPATEAYAGPHPRAAALGSWLWASISRVEGPAGGAFQFWESGVNEPTISIPSGSSATNEWRVSESNGNAGLDPYGHIHGRRFTATLPGVYTVYFRAVDRSHNGSGGSAIHTSSELLPVTFQAGVNLVALGRAGGVTSVAFGTYGGNRFTVESASGVGSNSTWSAVSQPVSGNDRWQTLTHTNGNPAQFYRVRLDVAP